MAILQAVASAEYDPAVVAVFTAACDSGKITE